MSEYIIYLQITYKRDPDTPPFATSVGKAKSDTNYRVREHNNKYVPTNLSANYKVQCPKGNRFFAI